MPVGVMASATEDCILVTFSPQPAQPSGGSSYTFFAAEAVPQGKVLGGAGTGFGGGHPSATGNASPLRITVGLQENVEYTVGDGGPTVSTCADRTCSCAPLVPLPGRGLRGRGGCEACFPAQPGPCAPACLPSQVFVVAHSMEGDSLPVAAAAPVTFRPG